MPWRTVLEVAVNWSNMGHETTVFSGDGVANEQEIAGVKVVYIERPKKTCEITHFVKALVDHEIECLYFPIAPGRLNRRLVRALYEKDISLVWYFPGAWYTIGQVVGAARVMPWRSLISYFIQACFPKRFWLFVLRMNGDFPIITMTPLTARRLVECGYPENRVYSIFPGKSPVARESSPISEACQKMIDKVSGKRFFLFFGPPSAIRGIIHILQAFQCVAKNNRECHLVCLFRNDENITNEPEAIHGMIKKMNLGSRLITCWKSVNPSELDWLLKNCFAVLKPFVIVPSEIPLAVIETAEYAKPVVGFSGDGTGEFVDKIGVAVKRFNSQHLADAMIRLLKSPDEYNERCDAAKQAYDRHITWDDVAKQWLQVSGDEYERENRSS